MLGFNVRKDAFVASATAIGVMVDAAWMPVYLAAQGREVLALWPLILIASAGSILGTLFGKRALARIPEHRFRAVVAVIVGVLGAAMLMRGLLPRSG